MDNKIGIAGKIVRRTERNMSIYETDNLYSMDVEIIRSSGVKDTLQVIFNINAVDSESIDSLKSLREDSDVIIYGSLQTYKDENKHFHMFVWAEYITIGKAQQQNEVMLEGVISKAPKYRKTPLGREICELSIRVNYIVGVEEALYECTKKYWCYIPCISWGRNAIWARSNLKIGQPIHVQGRLQSRFYIKDNVEKVTHEVSISRMQVL